jgi:hypothetical protein
MTTVIAASATHVGVKDTGAKRLASDRLLILVDQLLREFPDETQNSITWEKLGITPSYISTQRVRRSLGLDAVGKICDRLGISLKFFTDQWPEGERSYKDYLSGRQPDSRSTGPITQHPGLRELLRRQNLGEIEHEVEAEIYAWAAQHPDASVDRVEQELRWLRLHHYLALGDAAALRKAQREFNEALERHQLRKQPRKPLAPVKDADE